MTYLHGEGEAPAEPLTVRVKMFSGSGPSRAQQELRPPKGSTGWAENPFAARLLPESFPACGGNGFPPEACAKGFSHERDCDGSRR